MILQIHRSKKFMKSAYKIINLNGMRACILAIIDKIS